MRYKYNLPKRIFSNVYLKIALIFIIFFSLNVNVMAQTENKNGTGTPTNSNKSSGLNASQNAVRLYDNGDTIPMDKLLYNRYDKNDSGTALSGTADTYKSDTKVFILDSQKEKLHVKIAEHAPYLDDPEYDAKKMEWINNYPEEYESLSGKQVDSGLSKHSETEHTNFDFNSPQSHIKIAEHAPYLDDPEYDAKKMEWINNYPEEYESLSGKQVDSGLSYQKNIEVTTSDQYMEKSLGQRSVADKKWQKGGIFEGYSPEQEDISLRTQNSKKFRNYDGSITAQIGGNYHYADDFGKWQDIDFTITKSNYNGYAYENITNTIKTYFPETAGSKGVSISDKSMDIKIWKNPELLIYDANKNILHKESSLNNSAKVKDNIAQY